MSITQKLLEVPKLWERENDIIQWGVDRNIIGDNAQATFESQQEKTRLEWEEWKRDHTADDLGDLFVTLVMGAALKGTTVSECVIVFLQEHELGTSEEYLKNNRYNEHIKNEDYLDENVEKYLATSSCLTFFDKIFLVIDSLIVNSVKRGWTLEECINVAWEDIKDRKGKMIHNMYIKQKDLDALSELGVEVVGDNGGVFFEGVGSKMAYNDFTAAEELFDKLSLKFDFFEDMKYLRTTGRI